MPGQDPNPNARAPFVDTQGRLTKYGVDIISKIYRVLGIVGNTSTVTQDVEAANGFTLYRPPSNKPHPVIVLADYETCGDEVLDVAADCTVTLNDTPKDREICEVKLNGPYECVISGNGKTIDGDATVTIFLEKTHLVLTYYVEFDRWLIV